MAIVGPSPGGNRAAEAPGGTSLVLIPSIGPQPDEDGPRGCPSADGRVWLSETTGALRPWRCGRLICAWCVVGEAWGTGWSLAVAQPERWFTLTLAGDDWQTIRGRMRRLAYDIRREGHALQWAWQVEANPAGTGHHVHGWQHGAYIPQRTLSRLADYRGMGRVAHVQAWHGGRTGYALKGLESISYGLKEAERAQLAGRYLAMNGRRLVHASRGFWRRKVDDDGFVAISKRAARAHGLRLALGEDSDPGPWVLKTDPAIVRAMKGGGGDAAEA